MRPPPRRPQVPRTSPAGAALVARSQRRCCASQSRSYHTRNKQVLDVSGSLPGFGSGKACIRIWVSIIHAAHLYFNRCDRLAVARLQVRSALCDDLNTPQVVSALSGPLKALNDLLHTKKVSEKLQMNCQPVSMPDPLQQDMVANQAAWASLLVQTTRAITLFWVRRRCF